MRRLQKGIGADRFRGSGVGPTHNQGRPVRCNSKRSIRSGRSRQSRSLLRTTSAGFQVSTIMTNVRIVRILSMSLSMTSSIISAVKGWPSSSPSSRSFMCSLYHASLRSLMRISKGAVPALSTNARDRSYGCRSLNQTILHSVMSSMAAYLHFWQTHVRRSKESEDDGMSVDDQETRWKI